MKTLIYNPGTILLLETGEYSDFGYCAQLVTLRELDLKKAETEYREQYKPTDEYDEIDPDGFVAWLCSTQRCAHLDCETAHIGGYGRLEI